MTSIGDASPIRSFEVTPSTLAESFYGDPTTQAGEAMEAFRTTLDCEKVYAALEHGEYLRLRADDLPGCFSFLALTLLVDSLLEEHLEGLGPFRAKLANFLGVDRSFSNLTGIAKMWRDLDSWLDTKIASGQPYRSLVLPVIPPSWTHIGYSLRLSFPSRRDKRLMRRFIDEHQDLVAKPNAFLAAFRNVVAGPHASWGMKEAFEEFHHDFLAGRRALGGHRFWLLVQAIADGRQNSAAPLDVSIEMTRDQDDAWVFSLTAAGREQTKREYLSSLEAAADKAKTLYPHDLVGTLARGILTFRQTGHARWRAAASPSECVGRVMVGMSSEVSPRIRHKLGRMVPSGSWFLTEQSVPIRVLEDALMRLGSAIGNEDRILSASIFDGVRSGPYWLGRRRFLPRIAADGSELQIRSEDGKEVDVHCVEMDGASGIFRLTADRALDGSFLISPTVAGDGGPAWSKRLFFVADALVHESGESGSTGSPLLEWEDFDHTLFPVAPFEVDWDDAASELDDLIEAIYAGGKSGWDEMDLISTIQEATVGEVSPWDLLRSLQESTLLKPMLRRQWKGRIWSLVPPSLISLPHEAGQLVIAQGCLGSRLIDEFKRAVVGAGGTAFRRRGVSRFAPMLVGCVNADADILARRVGWPSERPLLPGKRQLAFCLTSRRPDRYMPASHWCWEKGRFVPPYKGTVGRISLTRWAHPGGRDHDIYVVARADEEWHLLSRAAAITLAHSLSATPLFSASNGYLHRLTQEGALPEPLAATSRIRHLVNPGPCEDGRSYTYSLGPTDIRDLVRILPNVIDGAHDSTSAFSVDAISSTVHSGGRVRVTWKGGRLSTTHSS